MKIANSLSYDIILALGDITTDDFEFIKRYSHTPIYGVLGNHDTFKTLYESNVENLHNKLLEFKFAKLIGFEGSYQYKDGFYPSYTQEEAIEYLSEFPYADILITHSSTYEVKDNTDNSHQGLIGIDEYIKKFNIKLHLHGHLHENKVNYLKNGTVSICCYGFVFMEIDSNLNLKRKLEL